MNEHYLKVIKKSVLIPVKYKTVIVKQYENDV